MKSREDGKSEDGSDQERKYLLPIELGLLRSGQTSDSLGSTK